LRNPLMLASGLAGYGEELAHLVDLNRVGAVVTKTITLGERAGNPAPRLVETPAGLINSIGLANVGLKAFVRDVLPRLRRLNTRIVVSVGGSDVREYERVAAGLDKAGGFDAMEINISCPNVSAGGAQFGSSSSGAASIVGALRPLTDLPLIVKLTPNVTDIADVAVACVAEGADALTVSNTFKALAIDIHTRRPLLGTVTGGLSGPAIRAVSLAKVWEVASAVEKPVIACGGITSASDALESIIAGATAFQVGTACLKSFGAPELILDGIDSYCRENALYWLSELRGTLEVP
jgi:dihydroorotate dehydrogenase (NAD+) catalytic subunit